jgi:hypothetical protein
LVARADLVCALSLEPLFTEEIEYRDITSDGLLRASSFRPVEKLV